ncbi:MAG: protein phosphatase CheZ [Candidatus Thiodiazotropha sp.]
MGQKLDKQQRLETARALVASLEAGDEKEADRLTGIISSDSGKEDLFIEVGRLTRELHDAINGFLLDARISNMTEVEIPDAKERLNYVITMTQQSADRTLTAVEHSLPVVEQMEKRAGELSEDWNKLRMRMLSKDEFKGLSDALAEFLEQTRDNAVSLHGSLSEVLMAQDFQDLTGQIIRKVITLVHDVEEKLVKLVRITGNKLEEEKTVKEGRDNLAGPAIPGLDQGDQMQSQDEVDDLLSSLGF